MSNYHARQMHIIDPNPMRIPEDIRLKMSSDSGVTKWLNLDYETYLAIAAAIVESELKKNQSHDLTLVSSSI